MQLFYVKNWEWQIEIRISIESNGSATLDATHWIQIVFTLDPLDHVHVAVIVIVVAGECCGGLRISNENKIKTYFVRRGRDVIILKI